MTNYNDGNWHKWYGEDMKPVSVHDKSIVEFIWHDETNNETGKLQMHAGWNSIDERPAWPNILKFRVIKEHREPREWWINPTDQSVRERCKHDGEAHYKGMGYIHVREVIE